LEEHYLTNNYKTVMIKLRFLLR